MASKKQEELRNSPRDKYYYETDGDSGTNINCL